MVAGYRRYGKSAPSREPGALSLSSSASSTSLLRLLSFPGALRKVVADPRPPVQLRIMEGRLGIFHKAWHRDRSI
jgi:hypothetical protein